MAIGPISPVSMPITTAVTAPGSSTAPTSVAGATAPDQTGGSFESAVGSALDNLTAQQGAADTLAKQAATGQLTDVSQYLVASTEAQLSTQLTVAVRNKAVEAFQDIMRMQI
jgi:flagellar hook-basal body complex protein FliE